MPKFNDYGSLPSGVADAVAARRAADLARSVYGFPQSLDTDSAIAAAVAELIAGGAVVADNAARTALFPNPQGNERVFNLSSGVVERYNAATSAWVADETDYAKTTTSTANAEVFAKHAVLNIAHTAPSDTLEEGLVGEVNYKATAVQGAGHAIAVLGKMLRDNTGGGVATANLLIGVEGSIRNFGTGTITFAIGVLANLNQNDGTITQYIGHSSQAALNTGTIGILYHYHINAAAPGGTVTTEYSFFNPKASAILAHLGKMYGPLGYTQLLAAGELVPPFHPGLKTGRYYFSPMLTGIGPAALVANNIYTAPIFIPHGTTITKLGFKVTTAVASSNARIGLYRMAGGIPTTLVIDGGAVSTATTGDKEQTVSQAVEGGTYALALVADSAISINFGSDVSAVNALGRDTSSGTSVLEYAAFAYAPLPASFPAVSYTDVGGTFPALWYRI